MCTLQQLRSPRGFSRETSPNHDMKPHAAALWFSFTVTEL